MNASQTYYNLYPTPSNTHIDNFYQNYLDNDDISFQYAFTGPLEISTVSSSSASSSPWSGTQTEIIDTPYYHETASHHLNTFIPTVGASSKLTPVETSLTRHDAIVYYPSDTSYPSAYLPNTTYRVTSSSCNTAHTTMTNSPSTTATTNTTATSVGSGDNEVHRCRWFKCDKITTTLDQLIIHIREDHVGSGKPAYFCFWAGCPRSKKPFTKRHKMHNHMRTHTGERPFQCTVQGCSKRFSRPDSLSTHIKTHSNIRPYHCSVPGCGKAYFHSRSLRKHTRSHEEQQQQQRMNHHHGHQQSSRHNNNNNTAHPGMMTATSNPRANMATTSNITTTASTSTAYQSGADPRFFPMMDPSAPTSYYTM
ncbi:hypothetical protein BDA99DRAFT_521730 [Phascolomyces articulosus]|uniref:C2H2-type domain-containing protein n=1 Tax=Phascolomyces articulosus TaxID=60185 RepID=A0AAD5PBF7_9FUNG|nr:hypothetical protein BDA99DRAFT_521730 [Phascolomyces articulosus]